MNNGSEGTFVKTSHEHGEHLYEHDECSWTLHVYEHHEHREHRNYLMIN